MGGGDWEWTWAHILWQRHGLRPEEFAKMTRDVQLAYVSSELMEEKSPQNPSNIIVKALSRSRK